MLDALINALRILLDPFRLLMLFALPEIIDLLARGGAIHGMGSSIIDWVNYGIAAQTSKDRSQFGKGDVRGVIAPESANNAKEGGVLMPTLLFGVPGSSAMAMLLAALMIFGVQPGPQMLTRDLDLVFVIIWSLALANVFGTLICLLLSKPISRLTFVPFQYIAPVIIVIVVVGAWQETRHWADLALLLGFGVLGWIMKRSGMPRPPLLIGFILSGLAERYLWMSYNLYDWEWLTRPGVLTIGGLAVFLVVGSVMLKRSTERSTDALKHADEAEKQNRQEESR